MPKLSFKKIFSSPFKLNSSYVQMKEFFEGLKDFDNGQPHKPVFKVVSQHNSTTMNFPAKEGSTARTVTFDFSAECGDDYRIIAIVGHKEDWAGSTCHYCHAYRCVVTSDTTVELGRLNTSSSSATVNGNDVWVLLARKDLVKSRHGGVTHYE